MKQGESPHMKVEKEYQTESKELLNLMINSIYSNKEIFLRELISNASDAIDKYKYLALGSAGKMPLDDFKITLVKDTKERYLEVEDNGIGMTSAEMEKDLGTIARSGSKEFLNKYKEMKANKDVDLIGQFGVGFYSAFMVAKKVEVRSKALDGKGLLFTSDGNSTYTIEDCELNFTHGSSVRVYLKDDTDEEKYSDYLEDYRIEELVKKYSDYIRYPIQMTETVTKPDLDKDGKEIEGKTHTETELKTLNSMVPLWKKPKKDVTDEMLADFYKSKYGDYETPLLSLYIKAEGTLTYDALVFIPSHAPYNLYSENYEKGLDLYAKGIFIQEKCKQFVPDYLKFVKGLVDSDDFNLNVSREMLQNSPLLAKVAGNIETKIVERLKQLKSENYDKYLEFFKVYGDHLKYGIYSTYGEKKDTLQDLLVYPSLLTDKPISLKDYKDKMAKDQKAIYYASGKTLESIKLLPQMEKYKKDNVNVLLMADNIDEFCVMMLHDYDKAEFKNIASEEADALSQEEKDKITALTGLYKRTLDDFSEALKGRVDSVSFSTKLVDSPCCFTTKEGLSLNMEKVLSESNPQSKNTPDEEKPKAVKVLEINPDHPLFKTISKVQDDAKLKEYGNLMYDEAMLLEGYDIEDKKAFVTNLNQLMAADVKDEKK
jgi:molecular chaperone HtpG